MNIETNKSPILIVGSSNTDMVIKTKRLPRAGETVLGSTFFMNPGGKGANQAVAGARLGGKVMFICKTGNDIFGHQSQQLFEEEGIDTSYVLSDNRNPSGVALITVDENAENCIVVASGANANLLPSDLLSAEEAIRSSEIILMQLEIPVETVEFVAGIASAAGKKVILNPAPAGTLSKELLKHLYIITPNETEAEMISGVRIVDVDSAATAARNIASMGVQIVIITLGAKGALVFDGSKAEMINALKVTPVDTTAAGDVFNGALAVAIAENKPMDEAVRFACKAAAISVTRQGAQSSAPYRTEVDIF
jgi:ribokinase